MAGTKRQRSENTTTVVADKVETPRLFKVIFHNDDFTTMEFVIEVLMEHFHHPLPVARQITMKVHREGSGVAGVFTRDIAESKATRTREVARRFRFPLRVEVEVD